MSDAISAHGTIVKRNNIEVGELRDITTPALTRNTFDTSNQNDDDDSYVVGIRRKGDLTFTVNWLQSGDVTHGSATGLLAAYQGGTKDLYEIDFPDGSTWIFSGFLTGLAVKAPVDGELSADITIKPTNAMIMTP
jgi:hypothetical protein